MINRGPVSTFFLLLLAIATMLPTAAIFAVQGWDFYQRGGHRLYFGFAGIDGSTSQSVLANYNMVQDHFQTANCRPSPDSSTKIHVSQIDPETGEGANQGQPALNREYDVQWKFDDPKWRRCTAVGDSEDLWMIDFELRTYKFDGTKYIERESIPRNYMSNSWQQYWEPNSRFLLDGHLVSVIQLIPGQRELFRLDDGKWQSLGEIELLDTAHGWKTESGQRLFERNPKWQTGSRIPTLTGSVPNSIQFGTSSLGKIQILTNGSTPHLFWQLPDRLLYRRGIDLIPIVPEIKSPTLPAGPLTVSALEPENTDGVAYGWSLVADKLPIDEFNNWWPVFVGGEPAVIRCDTSDARQTHVKALHLVNGRWTEFAEMKLPFLSHPQGIGYRDDRSMSYLVIATDMGRTQVLALEPEGFRLTRFNHRFVHPQTIAGYFLIPVLIIWALISAGILTPIAEIAMRRDTAQYEFGLQTVSTASLWRRGVARVIDLTLVAASTAGLYWLLQSIYPTDWLIFLEAMQARPQVYDHPPVIRLLSILTACFAWLSLSTLAIIVIQGQYGITPGKWLMGLRTVRMTLRPPGIARSLLREILLYVDSVILMCWAPGIFFITFSKCRQRIGDLIANTVVVRSNSLDLSSRHRTTVPQEVIPTDTPATLSHHG